jgi:hypothetical protein
MQGAGKFEEIRRKKPGEATSGKSYVYWAKTPLIVLKIRKCIPFEEVCCC